MEKRTWACFEYGGMRTARNHHLKLEFWDPLGARAWPKLSHSQSHSPLGRCWSWEVFKKLVANCSWHWEKDLQQMYRTIVARYDDHGSWAPSFWRGTTQQTLRYIEMLWSLGVQRSSKIYYIYFIYLYMNHICDKPKNEPSPKITMVGLWQLRGSGLC